MSEIEFPCVLCSGGVESGELRRATMFNTHEKLQRIGDGHYQVKIRLENALDSIAGDISYHSRCPLKHTKNGYSDNGVDKDQCKTEDTAFN